MFSWFNTFLKSHMILKKTKIPVVTYASGTLVLRNKDEETLS
jgi:hypothetical protein